VAVTNLGRRDPPDLFEPESRHRLRAQTHAMDKVRDRFGFTAIRPGRLLQLDPPQ
jgi:hypothetical protein